MASISVLTVSCSKKETINNNNQDVQKPGTGSVDNSSGNNGSQNPDQGENNIKPEDLLVEQKLQQAFDGFNITKKEGINFTNVLAKLIDKESFAEYFNVTIGTGFEENKGFKYEFISATPKAKDATQLDVVYKISYGGKTQQKPFTFDGFETPKPLLPIQGVQLKNNWPIQEKSFQSMLRSF